MAEGLQLDHYLPYRLSVVSNQVSAVIARIYQGKFGLNLWEWRVIAIVGAHADPITAQQAAEKAAMDKMTVSRAVSRLLDRGLITRTPSPDDRRARLLRLTRAGQAIHDEVAPLARDVEAELLTELNGTETGMLFELLERLEARARAMAKHNGN